MKSSRSSWIRRSTLFGACLAVPVTMLPALAPASAEPPPVVTIRVDATRPGHVIPRDFLGLSFEADLLHQPWIDPTAGNVDTLLTNLGTGNLRFSANQVDNTAWTPDPDAPPPAWANGKRVTPGDLTRVGALARSTGWSVDLGVNLGHFDPAAAANQVAAAHERIGESLRSVQIGNEPNVYLLAPLIGAGERRPYLPQSYVTDARAYRDAIGAAAPTVAVEGPDTAGVAVGNEIVDPAMTAAAVTPWLDTYVSAFGAQSRRLNQHYYPFVNTARLGFSQGSSDLVGGLPTIDKLMSPATAARQTEFLREFAARSRRAGLEPTLSETNSVAKEGREGVTDSFGAALWTVDYLLTAAREGVTGVNLHNQPGDCRSYTLICFPDDAARTAGAARPNPNYYGALLVSRMVGGAVLPVTVESGGAHVAAHAVRMPDGTVRVAVDNLDRDFRGTVQVEIVGATGRSASLERLSAPSPDATDGTRFAGAVVAADGTFTAGPAEPVSGSDGRFPVGVEEPGAVLLSAR